MENYTVGILLLLVAAVLLHLLTRRKSATLAAAWVAIRQAPLEWVEERPGGGDEPAAVRIANAATSILYYETRRGGHTAQTIDFVVRGMAGGFIITFRDRVAVKWTQNAVERDLQTLSADECNIARSILAEAVAVVRRTEPPLAA